MPPKLQRTNFDGIELIRPLYKVKEKEIIAFLHFPPVFNGYKCAEIIQVLKKHGIKRCYNGHKHKS